MAEAPSAKRGAGAEASTCNTKPYSLLLHLPSSAASLLYESLTTCARRSLFAASHAARAFVLEHAENVTVTPHVKADPAVIGHLANLEPVLSRITLKAPIHGATNLAKFVDTRPWRVVFQGCPVRSRTLQSLSSFTHLTWVSLVGVSLSEDSLPPALATHVPKLQGLTLIRVTRAHRAGVQSPPTPGQGGDGGAEGSEKQARPLITSLPSQLQHLEVEEVASDLLSSSAHELITRLVIAPPQRRKHGLSSDEEDEDEDEEDSEEEEEDDDDELAPSPWEVVICGGLPRLHTLSIEGSKGIDAGELARVVRKCPLLKFVQLPQIRYPYQVLAEAGVGEHTTAAAAAAGGSSGGGASTGSPSEPVVTSTGPALVLSHPIHLTLTLPTDVESLLLLPLASDPPQLLSLSLPAGCVVAAEGVEDAADVVGERLGQLHATGTPLPLQHRVPAQPVGSLPGSEGMTRAGQGRRSQDPAGMSGSHNSPVHIPIIMVKGLLNDQNCIMSDAEPPGAGLASSLAGLALYGLQRVVVSDVLLGGEWVTGCAQHLGRRLEVLEAHANCQYSPTFWSALPELPSLRALIVKDTVATDHVLELAQKLSQSHSSSLLRSLLSKGAPSSDPAGSKRPSGPRPKLLLCLAGTNAAWNEARLRTALQKYAKGAAVTVTHGWKG